MKYKILTSEDPARLEVLVDELKQSGWEEQGGVAIAQSYNALLHRNERVFAQALVPLKENERKIKNAV